MFSENEDAEESKVEFDLDETEEIQPKKKISFGTLLGMARLADDEILDYEIDPEELGQKIHDKIDGIVEYLDYCDAKAAAIQARANELYKKARAFRNAAENLRNYVTKEIHTDVITRFPEGLPGNEKPTMIGHNYQFQLKYSRRCEIIKEPDPLLFLQHGDKFIDRSYRWRKDPIKALFDSGDARFADYAVINKHPILVIKPTI